MSSINILVDLCLGDSGKGRITDVFSENSDMVIRCSGGGNCGHTLVIGDKKIKLHHIPSGVARNKICLLSSGMVINPIGFCDEIKMLEEMGFNTSNIFIDGSAHINFPMYSLIDKDEENIRKSELGGKSIGTTAKGIGPAYSAKYRRTGWRYWQILENYNSKLNKYFQDTYYNNIEQAELAVNDLEPYFQLIKPRIIDGRNLVREYINKKKDIFIEGAQGCWLDVDYGQYPFVTSSFTTAAGACLGTGIGIKEINQIYGVTKAYSTYVGNGAYIAEASENDSNFLREKGGEYGTTTGRPRRCGYFDVVMIKNAIKVNSCTEIVLTKIDVLSGLDKVKIVKSYELDGKNIDYVPSNPSDYARCKPVYEEFDGWEEIPQSGLKFINDLPSNARKYIQNISDYIGHNINTVSYGPERNQFVSGYMIP